MATKGSYDIVIMDLNMPIMDGFKATQKIVSYYSYSNLFVGGGLLNDEDD